MSTVKKLLACVLLLSVTFTGCGQMYTSINPEISVEYEEDFGDIRDEDFVRTIAYEEVDEEKIAFAETIETYRVNNDDEIVTYEDKNRKFGFINAKTGETIGELYDKISEPSKYGKRFDKYEAVSIDGRWMFIDSSGQIVNQDSYDYAKSFVNGYAFVTINGVDAMINSDFERIEGTLSSSYTEYKSGLMFADAFFSYSTGSFNSNVNTSGEYDTSKANNDERNKFYLSTFDKFVEVAVEDYDKVYAFADSIRVEKGDKVGFLINGGKAFFGFDNNVTASPYFVSDTSEYITIVDNIQLKSAHGQPTQGMNFINQKGELLLEDYHHIVSDFSENGFAAIGNRDGEVKIINTKGETTETLDFDTFTMPFEDRDLILLSNEVKYPAYGVYDLKNNLLIDQGNTGYMYNSDNDTITYVDKQLTGTMDRSGKIIQEPIWSQTDKENGYKIIQKRNHEYIMVNESGQVITDRTYYYLEPYMFNSNFVTAKNYGKSSYDIAYGLIDKEGRELIEPFQGNYKILAFEDSGYALLNRKEPNLKRKNYVKMVDFSSYQNPSSKVLTTQAKEDVEKYLKDFDVRMKDVKDGALVSFSDFGQSIGKIYDNGMSHYVDEDGKYHFWNAYSSYEIPGAFDEIKKSDNLLHRSEGYFSYGYEPVKVDDQWVYIDIDGNIVSNSFDEASSFEKGYALVKDDYYRVIDPSFETLAITSQPYYDISDNFISLTEGTFLYELGVFVRSHTPMKYYEDYGVLASYSKDRDGVILYDVTGKKIDFVYGDIECVAKNGNKLFGIYYKEGNQQMASIENGALELIGEPIYDKLFTENIGVDGVDIVCFINEDKEGYLISEKWELENKDDSIFPFASYGESDEHGLLKVVNQYSLYGENEYNYLNRENELVFSTFTSLLSNISSTGFFARGAYDGVITIYNAKCEPVKELEYDSFTPLNEEETLLKLYKSGNDSSYAVYDLESNDFVSKGYHNYEYDAESRSISFVDGHLTGRMDLKGEIIDQAKWTETDKSDKFKIVQLGDEEWLAFDETGEKITDFTYRSIEAVKNSSDYLMLIDGDYMSLIDYKGNSILFNEYGIVDAVVSNDVKYIYLIKYNSTIEVLEIDN